MVSGLFWYLSTQCVNFFIPLFIIGFVLKEVRSFLLD